jgi:TolB-like protein
MARPRLSGLVLSLHAVGSMKALASLALTVLTAGAALSSAGCGPTYVRGSEDPSIDNAAMSTGLDKDDIQRMLKENLDKLRVAPIMDQWRQDHAQDTVAVFPFENGTDQHIDSMLDATLSEAETWLVDSNTVVVVDHSRQAAMIAEVEGQQHPAFNPAHVAQYGKQLGVKYFLTGKVSASDERTDDARRVQYMFYLQVIETATSAIRWQNRAYVTKLVH